MGNGREGAYYVTMPLLQSAQKFADPIGQGSYITFSCCLDGEDMV